MSMPVTGPAPRWWAGAVNTLGVVVAVGLAAGTIYGGFIQEGPVHLRVAGALGLAAIALLAWRYRHPMAVLATELILAGAIDVLAGNSRLTGTARFVVVISLYVVGTRSDALRGLVAAGCSWLVLGGTELFDHRGIGHLASDLVLIAAVTATFFYVRSYRELIESYRERAEQAEREQGWQTNRAVTAERVRIARELHDVVAHHVSLLVVQAGAVRETIPADHPTRPVLDSMIDGGRHAMTELRDMLDALRVDVPEVGQVAPEVAPRMPQPDVDQVPELVSGARAAGLDVGLEIDGQANALPPTTSLAIYRIVQESLTNAVKHAPGAATRIRLTYGVPDFEVVVTNSATANGGPARSGAAQGSNRQVGLGLIGMRERVALAHGHLEIGPCSGGWQVRARLPGGADLPASREQEPA